MRNLPAIAALLILAAALLLSVHARVRLLDFPLERDEGEYAYAGQLILQGVPPYQSAWNMKLPGTYLCYAAILSLFGETPSGIHTGLLLIHLGTVAALYLLARKFCRVGGSALAAAAFTVMLLSPAFTGLAAHATHFVILPALLGVLLVADPRTSPTTLRVFCSGLLMGVAFLMKQPGIVFVLFGGLWVSFLPVDPGSPAWRQRFLRLLSVSAGFLTPLLIVSLWLGLSGVFTKFWFWTFTYAREYGTALPLFLGWKNLRGSTVQIFQAAPGLWAIAFLGLLRLAADGDRMRRSFLTGFSVFSFLGVAAGLYFRSHYFILMLPAACLLIGVAVDSWEESLRGRPALLLLLPQVAVAAALFQGFWNERQLLFTLSPTEACRSVYGLNPFPESLEVGRYLREHSDRDTKVAVIGSEPQIYFYSGRHSATGYLYTYPLMEIHPFARMMQEEMIREIETADPEYVVFVSIRASWLAWERSERLLTEWFRDYSARKLELVGVIDSFRSLGPVSLWGEEARAFRTGDDQCLLIYRRKRETEPHS